MTKPKTTRKGTPCAQSWDDAWVARVNESESSHGRRICGARTMAGTPCSLGSTHASGRCHAPRVTVSSFRDRLRNTLVPSILVLVVIRVGSQEKETDASPLVPYFACISPFFDSVSLKFLEIRPKFPQHARERRGYENKNGVPKGI